MPIEYRPLNTFLIFGRLIFAILRINKVIVIGVL